MNKPLLLFSIIISFASIKTQAADLPSISVEYLYYLRTRSQYLQKLHHEELIDYCLAQKLKGPAFEVLYSQLSTTRAEIVKLQIIDGITAEDARMKLLKKTYDAYLSLVREESQRIRNGLIHEGQIASDALDAIAKDQK
jgi:hypothetical protein